NDESNGQRIARREDRIFIFSFRKLIEVALYQNGAESPETHDLRSRLDRASRRRSNPRDVLMHIGGFQAVGRNKGVDVKSARLRPHALRTNNRAHLDMADRSGRNPWKDVSDLIVRQRGTLPSAQHRKHVRGRSPTLLMPDQSEIDVHSPPSPG